MRDEDECDPEFTNMSEQYVGDHVAGFGVERAGWLVADQQISRSGSPTSARAMATRCCSPPDRRDGMLHTVRLPSPTVCSMREARLLMTRRGMPPRYCNGSATFSHALRCGMRE